MFNDDVVYRISQARKGDEEALQALWERSQRYAIWRPGYHLSEVRSADVVQGAFAEMLEANTENPQLTDDELANVFIRTLEKLRKREQRRIQVDTATLVTIAEPWDPNHGTQESMAWRVSTSDGPLGRLAARDLLEKSIRLVFRFMKSELEKLSPRDRDLVIQHYGLESYFKPRSTAPDSRHGMARRKAIHRARSRLCSALEDRLAISTDDVNIVAIAYNIVRNEVYLKTAELYLELLETR